MKEIIKYYYDIYLNKLFELINGYYFFYNDDKYYFVKYDDIEKLDLLVNIINTLKGKGIEVNEIVFTKDNRKYVNASNENYVLIKVCCIEDEVLTLNQILYIDNLILFKNNNYLYNNWSNSWKKIIDELEEEINDLGNEYKYIKESIDFFIGWGEIGIELYDEAINSGEIKKELVLTHKNINNTYKGYILNPVKFTIDYNIRDISSYYKKLIYDDVINEESLNVIIKKNCNNINEEKMFFSRMLFPDIYFEKIKNILEDNLKDEELKEIIYKYIIYYDKIKSVLMSEKIL